MELERSDRWTYLEKLLELERRIAALRSQLNADDLFDWDPPLDILDEGASFRIVVDVPGVKPDDIELQEEGRTLTIAGVRHAPENAHYVSRSRPHGYFHKVFTLPEPIVEGGAEASLKQGVLEIKIPKARGRSVPVETG